MINAIALEDMAMNLRDILDISPDIILNENHLDELQDKIEGKFAGTKIVTDKYAPYVTLEKEKLYTIHIYGNQETRFYDLVEQFIFTILLDKKSLSAKQLQYSCFRFPRLMSEEQKAVRYLMLAFMMPRRAFVSALVQYSSGDGASIRMFEMQREVNKYCHQRGIYLQLW